MYNTSIEDLAPAPVRWLYVVPLAIATTFALLVLMFKLVYMEEVAIDFEPTPAIPQVHWEDKPPIEIIRETPKKPDEVKPTPPKPEIRDPENTGIAHGIPTGEYEKPDYSGNIAHNFDVPIEQFIVTPRYPGRALARNIEGFVQLRFDVNKIGATENIEVVRAEPTGYFENAAIAAAERWKFQPKTEDGEPVYFRGLSKVVTFEIPDS